ncbi:hypothetical protein [Pseudonocardia xishanensis]|uniref:Mce-associated membrane protein n=1 Tax=Pseudonocardia xishanensis TaxID=630995 RepID=A0ABP8RTC3_9PSEU
MSLMTKVGGAATAVRPRMPAPVVAKVERMPGRSRRLLLVIAALVAALAVIAAVTFAALTAYRSHITDTARTEATEAARTSVAQVLSYSPQTVDADMARARENVTGDFATEFNGLLGSLVQPAVTQGLTTTTTATRAGVVEASPSQVQVLLYLEQRTTRPDTQPTANASKALVTMTDVDGRWLISDLRTA